MWRTLHPNVRTRITTSFLSRVVGSMVFPFLAIYFTAHLGAALAGTLLLTLGVVQFLAGLYGGALADAWGRRTLLTGEGLKLLAFAAMLAANGNGPHPWATFAAVVLVNVASGLINPAAEAMLVDVSTPKSRSFMYAANCWAVNLSILLGTVAGGWLYADHFTLLLGLLVGMSLITSALCWTQMTETRAASPTARAELGLAPLARSYAQVVRDRAFGLFVAGGILILSTEFSRNNHVAVHLAQNFAASEWFGVWLDGIKAMSVLTAVNTLLIVALTAPVAAWLKGREERPVMYAGFALFALGFAVMAFSTSLPVLLGTLALSLGELLYVPTWQSALAELVPEDRRGAYLAVHGQVFTVSKWIAALRVPLGGLIGGSGMAGVTLALGAGGVLLTGWALRNRQPQAPAAVATR
ncbi:MFS transporter [Deinococcus hopiensis]|uniref:MFS transporter, DHA1 family, multidrug resistance protein B n=1 Tax=Deinococcus hopiensis KR-140 TaxID=695939 RepID=A0A1W1V5S2_9DEIO|nr:MFS transporter [Deinococcus hopiensis]SMB88635.1 MFS transporter, DHA1 family, multidrug resistance protein B [Deinococcus hopiensis KR-140]